VAAASDLRTRQWATRRGEEPTPAKPATAWTDAVTSGAAAAGEPWRFHDLGHGYCTYDFFAKCPHRMACARCSFYRPKGSSQAQLLEGKANLLRLKQDVPLTDDERAAVDDGVGALEKLCAQLSDVPAPGQVRGAARA
jgi:hypothetical protein